MLAPEVASYSQTGLGFYCFCVQFVPGTLSMKQDLPAELSDWYVGPISLSFLPSLLFFHSLCVCVYVQVCICICVHVHMCVRSCVGVCMCVRVHGYVCMCVCMHIRVFVSVCVCLGMRVRACSSTLACVEAWADAKCHPVLYVTLFLKWSLSLNLALVYFWLASRGPSMSLTLMCPLCWHYRCVPWVLRAHACIANILSTDLPP